MRKITKFVTLEEILGQDTEKLAACKQGTFKSEKVGEIPFTALDWKEYKQIKKSCYVTTKDGVAFDDDKFRAQVVIKATEKDQRSTFTFANKPLIEKFGVVTAEDVLNKLLLPGEIVEFALDIQDLSGWGEKAEEETAEAIKN